MQLDLLQRKEWAMSFIENLESTQTNIYLPTIMFNPEQTIFNLKEIKRKLDEVVC